MAASDKFHRIDFKLTDPQGYAAMGRLERHVREGPIEHALLELVKVRASQINGCAFCVDMHWKDARAAGKSEQRLYGLAAWREADYYSERERAALEWTEALTRVAETHVPDAIYAVVRPHFSDEELVALSLAIVAINGWNRMEVAFRGVPGLYEPGSWKPVPQD